MPLSFEKRLLSIIRVFKEGNNSNSGPLFNLLFERFKCKIFLGLEINTFLRIFFSYKLTNAS